jgi:hypothetical protein
VIYIGYERGDRRHVLVSLEPGDRRVTTRAGQWAPEGDRLVLTSDQCRAICDLSTPGQLTLEFSEEPIPGREFIRFRAEYRVTAGAPVLVKPAMARQQRRFVIA